MSSQGLFESNMHACTCQDSLSAGDFFDTWEKAKQATATSSECSGPAVKQSEVMLGVCSRFVCVCVRLLRKIRRVPGPFQEPGTFLMYVHTFSDYA